MQTILAPRASTILYNLLVSGKGASPWLLPANICPIVPITFFKAHIPFELVDISAETLHMDLELVEAKLKQAPYGGVLYAHTYGEPSTPGDFFARIKSSYPQTILIDDRCLCPPEIEPRDLLVDLTLYSTGYSKVVDLGFGGYGFIKEDQVYQTAHLKFDGHDYEEIEKAYKKAVQAREKYEPRDSDWLETERDLPAWYDYRRQIEVGLGKALEQRAALNRVYRKLLPAEIQLPDAYQSWRFNIFVEDKQRVLRAIFAAGLFASSHYESLAGIMSDDRAQQAEDLSERVINLFNDRYFTLQKAEQTCKIILENLS